MSAFKMEMIPFHGDMVFAGKDSGGEVLVSVKPICETLGLRWNSQLMRIKRTEVLSKGMLMMSIPSAGGEQETVCLPLKLIPGWLFGVDTSRVRAEIRVKLEQYQAECFDVLWRHFSGKVANDDKLGRFGGFDETIQALQEERGAEKDLGVLDQPLRVLEFCLGMVREARLTRGAKAAAQLWDRLPLPSLDGGEIDLAQAEGPVTRMVTEWVAKFLGDCTAEESEARLSAGAAYAAYCDWRRAAVAPPLSATAFGRSMSVLGWRKIKQGSIFYVGLTLKAAWGR